jgi:hypothetical protein
MAAFIRFLLFFFVISYGIGLVVSPGPILMGVIILVVFVVSLFLAAVTE